MWGLDRWQHMTNWLLGVSSPIRTGQGAHGGKGPGWVPSLRPSGCCLFQQKVKTGQAHCSFLMWKAGVVTVPGLCLLGEWNAGTAVWCWEQCWCMVRIWSGLDWWLQWPLRLLLPLKSVKHKCGCASSEEHHLRGSHLCVRRLPCCAHVSYCSRLVLDPALLTVKLKCHKVKINVPQSHFLNSKDICRSSFNSQHTYLLLN